MVVCGRAGTGKTRYIWNLIHAFSQGQGTFASICIVTQHSESYAILKTVAPAIVVTDTMPSLQSFARNENYFLMFDEFTTENPMDVVNTWLLAHCRNISCIYTGHAHCQIPSTTRKTCYYSVLLQCEPQEVDKVLAEHGLPAITKERLQRITDSTEPLLIDMRASAEHRFRRGVETICVD
jgi:hypothetical protein